MVLLIDNYDSFTYNIVEYLKILGSEVVVYKNDDDRVFDLDMNQISHLVISPGPGKPVDSNNSLKLLESMEGKIPILGVCLGFQCIHHLRGGTLLKGKPAHGIVEEIFHGGTGLYKGLKSPLKVTRYHSLYIDEGTLGTGLEPTSRLEGGMVMSIQDARKMLYGVQYHPEAILTEGGLDLLRNFLSMKPSSMKGSENSR